MVRYIALQSLGIFAQSEDDSHLHRRLALNRCRYRWRDVPWWATKQHKQHRVMALPLIYLQHLGELVEESFGEIWRRRMKTQGWMPVETRPRPCKYEVLEQLSADSLKEPWSYSPFSTAWSNTVLPAAMDAPATWIRRALLSSQWQPLQELPDVHDVENHKVCSKPPSRDLTELSVWDKIPYHPSHHLFLRSQ